MTRKLSLIFAFALLLGAFTPVFAQDGPSGEITVHLQVYYRPEQHPEHSAIAEQVAQDYMEMNPNATINLLPDIPSGSDYIT